MYYVEGQTDWAMEHNFSQLKPQGMRGNRTLWPPQLSDQTLNFHFWGYIKDKKYVFPLPQSLLELQDKTHYLVMSVHEDMLWRVWDEIALRSLMYCIKLGSHVKHL
jgi:hypothetical protein